MMLSIIITDYITHKFLEELDKSLSKIKIPFEIVHITNDNLHYKWKSTKKYKSYYFPLGNVSGSKNYGLQKSKGDYVLMIDNDDYLLNADQIKKLEKDVYFCKYQNNKIHSIFNGMIIRKKLFKEYNLFFLNVKFYEDFLITTTLYNLIKDKIITNELFKKPLYFYRNNPNSICNTLSKEEKIIELKKIRKYKLNEMQFLILDKLERRI